MPLSDIECLTVLDALDSRANVPADCDPERFASEGLIEPVDGAWQLTIKGRLYLANLRTMQRQKLKNSPH